MFRSRTANRSHDCLRRYRYADGDYIVHGANLSNTWSLRICARGCTVHDGPDMPTPCEKRACVLVFANNERSCSLEKSAPGPICELVATHVVLLVSPDACFSAAEMLWSPMNFTYSGQCGRSRGLIRTDESITKKRTLRHTHSRDTCVTQFDLADTVTAVRRAAVSKAAPHHERPAKIMRVKDMPPACVLTIPSKESSGTPGRVVFCSIIVYET